MVQGIGMEKMVQGIGVETPKIKRHTKNTRLIFICDKENIIKTSPRSPPNQGAR